MFQTVNEFEEYTKRHDLPLERMRFCINEDKWEPRWFGIYYDNGSECWIVYKNKDDGSRFTRYSGKTEKEAVMIFYEKMAEEAAKRGIRMPEESEETYQRRVQQVRESNRKKSYYSYQGETNHYSGSYSGRNDGSFGGKIIASIFGIIIAIIVTAASLGSGGSRNDSSNRYHSSSYYDSGYHSSSYDSDYSSGFDSWDSGDTDWSSDW